MSHLASPNTDEFNAFEFSYFRSSRRARNREWCKRGKKKRTWRRKSRSASQARILKFSVDHTAGYRSSCARFARDAANELRSTASRSITRVKWHKRWCMRRQMTANRPVLPNDYRRLSLFLLPVRRTVPLRPSLHVSIPSRFPLAPPPACYTRIFSRGPVSLLTPWDNLQSRNEPQRHCRYDRTIAGVLSFSAYRDADKSSQTNIK